MSEHDNDLFFFSADDRQIDPSDPILRAVPSRGVVQQLRPHPLPDSRPTDVNVLSALRANPGSVGGGFPVSMSDDAGLLYSFTLPSSKPHPSKPPSVAESFGVLSTQVSRSSTASPSHTHSTTPSAVSDNEKPDASTNTASDHDSKPAPVALDETTDETIDITSRDVTPTPELCGNHSNLTPQETEQIGLEIPNFPPVTKITSQETLSDTHSNHSLPIIATPSKCDSDIVPASSQESSTPPFLPSLSIEEEMKLPSHKPSVILDSDIETSSVVSVQQLTEAYLNDPFDSAEEQLTTGTNNTVAPITLPAEVTFTRKSHTPTPVENRTLGLQRASSESTDYQHRSVTPEPSKLPSHILAPQRTSKRHGNALPSDKPIIPEQTKKRSPPMSESTDKSLPPAPCAQSLPPTPGQAKRLSPPTPRLAEKPSPPTPDMLPSHSPFHSFAGQDTTVADKRDKSLLYEELPEDDQLLRGQLTKALQAKANLEGQLDSVVSECKNTLKERASLQSKLSRAEARIADLVEALESEKQKNTQQTDSNTKLPQPISDHGENEQLKDELDKQKMTGTSLERKLAEEKELVQKLDRQVAETKAILDEQKESLTGTRKKLKDTQNELEKKKSELNNEQSKSSSLEASYGALEESKNWLQQQLQDSMETKMKLQRELSEAKTSAIEQSIKAEQLMEENAAFQDQITHLQRGVLLDKARMVSELEAIEADVLSREDSLGHLLAEREELKTKMKMAKNTIDKTNSELAKALVEKEETGKSAERVKAANDYLTHTVEELKDELQTTKQALLDSELQLERSQSGLREKLRDTEAALAGKDGTIQGLKDASQIMKQELDMTNDGRTFLEAELEETKKEIAMLEGKLKCALEENNSISRASEQVKRELAADKETLSLQLMEKSRQLHDKDEELKTFESQSDDLIGHFKDLQNQFQSIATESDNVHNNVEEKDRVISHLAAEKDSMESELAVLREANERLDSDLTQLKQEKARLEGKLDTSPSKSLEEFQKLLQDKSRTQAELNSLKLAHQGELIKAQAKANHLESELRTAKKNQDLTQRDLDSVTKKHDTELSKLKDENDRLKSELQNASTRLETPLKSSHSPHLKRDLRQTERERNQLKSEVEQLTRQNKHLGEQLEREIAQRNEIERAGTVVAKNLKRNAQENERKLRDEIQELQLRIEKLSGQLTGMELTQGAMRDHTGELEVALAKRETALLKLSAQAQRILEEKELEDKAAVEKMERLEKQLQDSKQTLHTSKAVEKEERKKIEKLSREISSKNGRLTELEEQLVESIEEIEALKETICDLTTEKDKLLPALNEQTAKVMESKTRGKEELRAKEAEVEVLKQTLAQVRSQLQVVEGEGRLLREQLKRNSDKNIGEIHKLKQQLVRHAPPHTTAGSEPDGDSHQHWTTEGNKHRHDIDRPPVALSQRLVSDTPPHVRMTRPLSDSMGDSPTGGTSPTRYSEAMLAEMTSRLEEARKQGQKVAEIRKSGEIDALHEQLGTKNKKLHGLQSYLGSLRVEMGRMQEDMDRHTASLQATHVSTRKIASQIESVKRSAAPSSHYLTSPSSNHSNQTTEDL